MIAGAGRLWCPRRAEAGALPGLNGEPPRFFPDGDSWQPAHYDPELRVCSYCGSAHPDAFFAHVTAANEVGPTDKDYKVYLPRSPRKFYFQHLSEDEKRRFVDLCNAKAVKIGPPGRFYVRPYFMVPAT